MAPPMAAPKGRTLEIVHIFLKYFINLNLFRSGIKRFASATGMVCAAAVLAACQTPPVAPPGPVTLPGVGTPPIVIEIPPKAIPRPPRIGLALGGGAARGFAHIGVIQVLEENGTPRPTSSSARRPAASWLTLYASGKSGAGN